jgi:hypothetical protein
MSRVYKKRAKNKVLIELNHAFFIQGIYKKKTEKISVFLKSTSDY